MTDESEAHVVEVEGVKYKVLKKPIHGETCYSFDGGETWRPTLADAFARAQERGALLRVGHPVQTEEFEASVLALLQEVQGLDLGESLTITRGDGAYVVTKKNTVLTFRASTLREVDLRIEED